MKSLPTDYTAPEFIALTGYDNKSVYEAMDKGILRTYSPDGGKRWLISAQSGRDYIAHRAAKQEQKVQIEKLCYTVDQFRIATGYSKNKVYAAIKRGDLRTFKDVKRRMISKKAAEDFIASLENLTLENRNARLDTKFVDPEDATDAATRCERQ